MAEVSPLRRRMIEDMTIRNLSRIHPMKTAEVFAALIPLSFRGSAS